ncbi:hypothetical protein [Thiomicrorhabdus sp.]|uniref:hypothetical protein n=1 Tax=Thiomicrorhabdus sp. TaxID=2039724 RepID=UPI003563F02A
MKNSMQDLNNHLFAQLERLNDEDMSPDQMKTEINKANAMANVAKVISQNAALELKAQQMADDGYIHSKPKILQDKKPAIGSQS